MSFILQISLIFKTQNTPCLATDTLVLRMSLILIFTEALYQAPFFLWHLTPTVPLFQPNSLNSPPWRCLPSLYRRALHSPPSRRKIAREGQLDRFVNFGSSLSTFERISKEKKCGEEFELGQQIYYKFVFKQQFPIFTPPQVYSSLR